ncbi:hypothetical protein THIAE_08775 [Thiomicrospira aerophila AL3]|jgi:hypothetical protein|uniref:Uncharacterized protein n=1 Tax=Thiomicrospira aerophila AL3 TaxID=717772 RepID=W0DV96_9GAMM|nr:hypothetical protein [Thiomicrospira aerophila]AHF02367.1 hypothetical protein THIAE_08775 [Thiomicrospira aerophila AL3]
MVSVKILSRFTDGFSDDKLVSDNRKISEGPLYPVAEVIELLKSSEAIKIATRKANIDAQNLDWDADDLALYLERAVVNGRYLGSEWTWLKSGVSCAACDAYRLNDGDLSYYFKFAIGKTGALILIVSCHLSS